MKIKQLLHNSKKTLIPIILIASFLLSSAQISHAAIDRIRDASIGENGACVIEEMGFDPTGFGDDAEWEADNPTCIAYVATFGLQIKIAQKFSSIACMSVKKGIRDKIEAQGKAAGVGFSPDMIKDQAEDAAKCVTLMVAGNYAQGALCCSGAVATGIAIGLGVAELAAIYGAAKLSQENAHLCGHNWNTWKKRPATQDGANDLAFIPNYRTGTLPNNEMYFYGKTYIDSNDNVEKSSYRKYLEDKYTSRTMTMAITDKEYREFIYGGVEFPDKGPDACKNPTEWDVAMRNRILGFSDDEQRYYMRGGAGQASNYACGRFLLSTGTRDQKESAKVSYECCKTRSQQTLCIEEKDPTVLINPSNYEFCKVGERCKVQHVWYDVHPSKRVYNYICATTYSVCPYNHDLGGGTELADLDNPYKVLENHCQYLKHCAKVPSMPTIRISNLEGGWISGACFDLRGDSQNEYEYTGSLTPFNKTRNFSAPIAQCFKETLENMFVNKAGNTKCQDPDESPDEKGECQNGYAYKAGEVMAGQQSFFQTIQSKLQSAIKLVMTIAVTIAGVVVLLTGTPWDKKTIIMFIIKLSLVSYFALGTAWQDYFFRGVSSASTDLANIFMKVDTNRDFKTATISASDQATLNALETLVTQNPQEPLYTMLRNYFESYKKSINPYLDGCQFPRYNPFFEEGISQCVRNGALTTIGCTKYDNPDYPEGKEYLQIWDMLDCKIARALGFGPEASIPNLVYMILAGLISSGLGIVFFVATFIFAYYLIALTVRALHIFLISSMAITLMIYVSPITITACLFKKTESIFKNWRTQLLGFVLQPVILFAYLGILITIFEATMIGDAQFSGTGIGAPKQINCSVGNAQNNSLYCIFQMSNIQTNNSLSPLGISLPVLFGMNQEKLMTIVKGAFLMYIFTQFLDKIPELAAKLLGGSQLSSTSKGAISSLAKTSGIIKAISARGGRAGRKWGTKAARKAGSIGGSIAGAAKVPFRVANAKFDKSVQSNLKASTQLNKDLLARQKDIISAPMDKKPTGTDV